MKTLKNWQVEKLHWDDERASGEYYNSPYILKHNDMEVVIGTGDGDGDTLHLFADGQHIILLSTNERHSYAGINVYNVQLEEVGDCFMQQDWDFMAMLEIDNPERAIDKFFNYSPMYQAKLLLQYVEIQENK